MHLETEMTPLLIHHQHSVNASFLCPTIPRQMAGSLQEMNRGRSN